MDFWVKLEVPLKFLVAIGVSVSAGMVSDVSVVVFNGVVSVVISDANYWEEEILLMSVSLNKDAGC